MAEICQFLGILIHIGVYEIDVYHFLTWFGVTVLLIMEYTCYSQLRLFHKLSKNSMSVWKLKHTVLLPISLPAQYKDVYWRTIEVIQRARILLTS